MALKVVRTLTRLASWCWKSLWFLLFLLTFSFFIASHTVTSLAYLTSAAISAIAGTGTVISDVRSKNTQIRSDLNDRLEAHSRLNQELETERQQATALRSQVRQDNLDARSVRILSRRVVEERSRADLLELEIRKERTRVTALTDDNQRLRQAQTINFRGQSTPIREAVEQTITSANARVAKTAAANVSSMPAESVPIYGVAVIAAATAFEVDMACRTMDDFYALQVALEPELANPPDRNDICGISIPTKEEIWELIKASPSAAWESGVSGLTTASDSIRNLETPNFGAVWQKIILSFDHWY